MLLHAWGLRCCWTSSTLAPSWRGDKERRWAFIVEDLEVVPGLRVSHYLCYFALL